MHFYFSTLLVEELWVLPVLAEQQLPDLRKHKIHTFVGISPMDVPPVTAEEHSALDHFARKKT